MRWVLISLAILLLVPLCACDTGTQTASDAYEKGWEQGLEQGRGLGYFSGFRDGAHVGYDRGYYEARIGLPSSMDWFYTDYPQYR